MRGSSRRDLGIQAALAALSLLPALWAFFGEGSFSTVFAGAGGAGAVSPRELVLAALGRSLAVGIGAALLALALGVPAAWALSARPRTGWLLALCAAPLALPASAAVSGWLRVCAPANVSSAFQSLALGSPVPSPLFSVPGVALGLGLGLWPIVTLEAWPAFSRARGESYAAALLCGSPARAFFRVVLPMCRGEVATGALLVFLLAASDFTVSSLLLVRTLPIEVHDQLVVRRVGAAAWTALPLVLVTAGAGWALLRRRRVAWAGDSSPELAPVAGPAHWPGWLTLGAGLCLGFLLPAGGCAAGALAGGHPLGHAFAACVPSLVVSLRLALAVALLAVVLGAARVVLWPDRSTGPLLWAGLLWLAIPGSFLAGGLLIAELAGRAWLTEWNVPDAWLPPALFLAVGYLLRFLYLPLRLAEEGLRALDPALLEAAELAGHGRCARGLGVALPLVWPHLLAAGALVFVLALGELPLSDQLAPPGAVPVCVWLFNQQHNGYTEQVFAACLLLGVSAVAGLVAVGVLARGAYSRGAR